MSRGGLSVDNVSSSSSIVGAAGVSEVCFGDGASDLVGFKPCSNSVIDPIET